MKTRIKVTEKYFDGAWHTQYQAEIFHWPTALSWQSIDLGWIDGELTRNHVEEACGHEFGTLTYAKHVIDLRIAQSEENKAIRKELKAIRKSTSISYIDYP